jgi:phosphate transport system permease protein
VQEPVGVELNGLEGSPARRRKEQLIRAAFQGTAIVSILISALIVVSLIGKAIVFLSSVDLSSLWYDGWFPRRGLFDIKTILTGTLVVTGIGMLVATPLGIGAAVYLSEYARPRVREVLKPILEILAGVPSVVIGFFALTWISPRLIQHVCSNYSLFNLSAAGVGVGILVTPLVASIAEDSMRAVPRDLREASYGMGARKMTTTVQVVFPAAVSGIMASLIVGLSRAIGETMVVAMVAGGSGGSLFSVSPCQPGQTMTGAMAALAIGSDTVAQKGAVESLFFVGLLLFLMTLVLNTLSERFVRKTRQRY